MQEPSPTAAVESDLLVVAGPAASGKTTFLEMLRAGRLQPSLEGLLPAGAREWPQFGERRRDSSTGYGKITLHYTMIYPHLVHSDFEHDPVLSPLLQARQATVLTIRSSLTQILHQYETRRIKRASGRGPLRTAIRQLRRHIRGRRNPDLPALYRTPGWLQKCYADWDAFLAAQSRIRNLILIDIVAVNDRPDLLTFNVARSEPAALPPP